MLKEYLQELCEKNEEAIQGLQQKKDCLEQSLKSGQEWLQNTEKSKTQAQRIFSPRIHETESQENIDIVRKNLKQMEAELQSIVTDLEQKLASREEYQALYLEFENLKKRSEYGNSNQDQSELNETASERTIVDTIESKEELQNLPIPAEMTVEKQTARSDDGENCQKISESIDSSNEKDKSIEIDENKNDHPADCIKNLLSSAISRNIMSYIENENGYSEDDKECDNPIDTRKTVSDESELAPVHTDNVFNSQQEYVQTVKMVSEQESCQDHMNHAENSSEEVDPDGDGNQVRENRSQIIEKEVDGRTVEAPDNIGQNHQPEVLFSKEEVQNILIRNNQTFKKKMADVYRNTEVCLALLNGNRNKCKNELRNVLKQIRKYAEEYD